MAQQTAVEWLKNRLPSLFEHDHDDFYKRIFEQSKQMEKEQIINACIDTASKLSDVGLSDITINGEIELAEQYYNETYGNEGV